MNKWILFFLMLFFHLELARSAVLSTRGAMSAQGFGMMAASMPKLVYTSLSQNVYNLNCSGIATIQTNNTSGVATNVSSNTTINLTGPADVTFYSDSACTIAVSSVLVASGTSQVTFYFIKASAGSAGLVASAAGYTAAVQNETVSSNPYIWTGGGANAAWSTGANWSGGSAPGSSGVAIFSTSCASNCSPNISVSISIGGVRMIASYSGTISQLAGSTIMIGSAGWTQLSGNFVGDNSSDSISFNSPLNLAGGTFKATSGTFAIVGPTDISTTLFNQTGGTFNHNNGTISFQGTSFAQTPTYTVSGSAPLSFYNVQFVGSKAYYAAMNFTATQALNVAGSLNIQNTNGGQTSVNSMNINLSGNLIALAGATGGTAIINMVGNAAQTYSGSGIAPNVVVNTTGSVAPAGGTTAANMESLTVANGTFLAPTGALGLVGERDLTATLFNQTGGTFNHNNGTISFQGTSYFQSPTYTVSGSAPLSFYNIQFVGSKAYYGALSFASTQTLNVAGSLTIQNTNGGATTVNSMTINLGGDLLFLAGATGGSAVVNMVGNAAQSYSGTGLGPNLVVNTTGSVAPAGGTTASSLSSLAIANGNFVAPTGTLSIVGSTDLTTTIFSQTGGTYTHSNGTISFQGTSYFATPTYTISGSAPLNFYHIQFLATKAYYGTVYFAGSPTMNVLGNLSVQNSGGGQTIINSMTLNANGNVSALAGASGGSATINIVGSGTQTITGVAGATFPNLNIAANGSVAFSGTIEMFGNYSFVSGALSAGSSTLQFDQGTSITVGGEVYNNVNFSDNGNWITASLTGTMNVSGTLSATYRGYSGINGGTLLAGGGIGLSNNGFGSFGSVTVKVAGSVSQTLSATAGSNIPKLTIASTGGTVSVVGSVGVLGATVVNSGAFTLANSSASIATQSLALNGNTFTKSGGTLKVNGSTVNTGSLYGGTVAP